MARRYPSPGKLALGLAAAAFAAAVPTLLLGALAVIALPIAFIVAALHAVILGLPAYLVLRRWFRLNYGNAAAAGLLIGGLPTAANMMVGSLWGPPAFPTVEISTFEMIRQAAMAGGIAGVLGAIGGLAFRGVLGPDEDVFEVDPTIFE